MAIAIAQFTISDFHDIYTSTIAPVSPTMNQLWCDTSTTPSLLKCWDGSKWVIVNDTTDLENSVQGITTKTSNLEQTINGFKQEVSETFTTKNEFGVFEKTVSNQIAQSNEAIVFNFAESKKYTNEKSEIDSQLIEKFIRFVNGQIEIGEAGSDFLLRITKQRISFMKGSEEVAYMSDNNLVIRNAQINNQLKIANFAFIPEQNNSVSLKKVA